MFRENYSLKSLNSFNLEINSRFFFEAVSPGELIGFINETDLNKNPLMIIGEGSNLLFQGDFQGLIIHPVLKGIKVISEDDNVIEIKVSAGENWDDFVKYCVEKGWGGLENLSLIPGSAGACPVQNIGAYGVEVKDRIISVEGIYLYDNKLVELTNEECVFGYRSSIFKGELKNKFIVCYITFQLDKKHRFELSYGPVREKFSEKKDQNILSLRQTIIEIRQSKLPDPKVLGNAGSFFKNPVVDYIRLNDLILKYPSIPSFPAEIGRAKIPAAWLIEQAGWKGKREGDIGCFPSQPLILVNYGKATGKEILEFSMKIHRSVKEMFGIDLEREVNIV